MEPARSYESMIGLLWLLSKDESKSHREGAFLRCEHQVLQFGLGFHTKKQREFDQCQCLFQSLSPRGNSKTLVRQRVMAKQPKKRYVFSVGRPNSLAKVSSTFATRWGKHRSLWIANELDLATLGGFLWVERWDRQAKGAGSGYLFKESLVTSAWFGHFLPGSVEIVEAEWSDKVFMWVMLDVACIGQNISFSFVVFLRLLTLYSW